MSSNPESANAPNPKGRPENVLNLVWQPQIEAGWFTENAGKNRFFVVGIKDVMSDIHVTSSNSQAYFDAAERVAQQAWGKQFDFPYKCSNVQIRTKFINAPRNFGKSAALIVGLELAANALRPGYNVYDNLRIVPGNYFVDDFDHERLKDLRAAHLSLDQAAKDQFPEGKLKDTFDATCLPEIGQWLDSNPLTDMSNGHTATKYACEELEKFINKYYPAKYRVGPSLQAGDERRRSAKLGSKHASGMVRVPGSVRSLK